MLGVVHVTDGQPSAHPSVLRMFLNLKADERVSRVSQAQGSARRRGQPGATRTHTLLMITLPLSIHDRPAYLQRSDEEQRLHSPHITLTWLMVKHWGGGVTTRRCQTPRSTECRMYSRRTRCCCRLQACRCEARD